jgi:Major Facilitator Superfamily
LTEYLSWRWCLYVNLLFAAVAGTGAVVLLHRGGRAMVSGGMFCIVYGFSNAATHTWGTPSTWGFLVAGAVLLTAFGLWQARTPEPLLPLRIVTDRNRAGAYLAMLLAGAGLFGILLFVNYYMQQNLRYSPAVTRLAFLPMVGMIMIFTNISNVVLTPRVGPRPVVVAGMLLGGTAGALLTRIGVHSSYPGYILPSVLLVGAGLGFIFAPAADTAPQGSRRAIRGASATIKTGNQLGGSIGTSLLNTIFASAIASYIAASALHHRPTLRLLALAPVHGYTVAFWWTAAIFAAGAVICGALLRWGLLARPGQPAQPDAATWQVARAGTPADRPQFPASPAGN